VANCHANGQKHSTSVDHVVDEQHFTVRVAIDTVNIYVIIMIIPCVYDLLKFLNLLAYGPLSVNDAFGHSGRAT
jgi:hypothetical protein